MAPRRIVYRPVLLISGGLMLLPLVAIVLAAAGVKLTPWPGVLVLSVFLIIVALVPIVAVAVGIKLTRARTLMAVVLVSIGAALIFTFGFHLGVAGLAAGGLLVALCVVYAFKFYARGAEDTDASDLQS